MEKSFCKICKRELTNQASIDAGIGPICRGNSKRSQHSNRTANMFGNRAQYTWGINGNILWLKDNGTDCRSLTNDIENCLVEISTQLPANLKLTHFKIIYLDSERDWDGIAITEMKDEIDIAIDNDWLRHSKKTGRPYWSKSIKINFFPIGVKSYNDAIAAIVADDNYKHFDATVGF